MKFFNTVSKIAFLALLALTVAAPAAGAATIQASLKPAFQADLTNTLKLQVGFGNPTYTRATTATVQDWEGLIKNVLSGEARFTGARRVHNLLPITSEVFTDTNEWTVNNAATITGNGDGSYTLGSLSSVTQALQSLNIVNGVNIYNRSFIASIYVKATGSDIGKNIAIKLRRQFGTSIEALSDNIVLTGSYQRIATPVFTGLSDTVGLNLYVQGAGTNPAASVILKQAMVEEVTGQSNQNPSEYVSCGTLAAPYHGAGVDCVKYFNTTNGNTVASNVVTAGTGSRITSSVSGASSATADSVGSFGYLAEGARTNLALQSQTLGTTWAQGDVTIAGDVAVAPDGTMTADKLQEAATTAAHYLNQVATASAGIGTVSVYLKAAERTKGWIYGYNAATAIAYFDLSTGTIGTVSGSGSPTATITALPNGWYRVTITATLPVNPNVGFGVTTTDNVTTYAGTLNNGIYAWGAQFEAAAFASSYIPTTTGSAARNADFLTYQESGNISMTAGTAYAEARAAALQRGWVIGFNSMGNLMNKASATNPSSLETWDGLFSMTAGNTVDWTSGVKAVVAWQTSGTKRLSLNGVQVTSTAYAGTWGSPSTIKIGTLGSPGYELYGTVRNVKIWKKALTDTQLKTMTNTNTATARAAVPQTTVKTPTKTGLVGHWTFNEGAGARANDSSGLGNFGTLISSPTWTTGKLGKGLSFNGTTSYVDTGRQFLSGTDDFTVGAWVKSGGSQNGYTVPISQGHAPDFTGFAFQVGYPLGNEMSFIYGDGASWRSVGFGYLPRTDYTWHFLSVTKSGNTITTYKDGVFYGTSSAYPLVYGSNNFSIGRDTVNTDSNHRTWNGTIDDVRIYNRALSAAEISALYRSTATVVNAPTNTAGGSLTSGLVGLWSFDGKDINWGTGTAYDRSGQGNNGSLTNMSTSTSPAIGKIGQALNFNGSNTSITTPALSFLGQVSASFTVSAWVKPRTISGSIFNNDAGGWNTGLLGFHSGKLSFYVYGIGYLDSVNAAVANRWVFVTATRDGATGINRLYENGVQVNTNSGTYSASGSSNRFSIGIPNVGCCQMDTPGYFNGLIDDARLYNRALSATEVKALYNLGR